MALRNLQDEGFKYINVPGNGRVMHVHIDHGKENRDALAPSAQ